MLPAPNLRHQDIANELRQILGLVLNYKTIVIAPYDLIIGFNSVQPDLMVFANIEAKQNKQLPTIVIEIISPSSIITDRTKKFFLYQSAGIEEYWIIDPDSDTLEIYHLVEGNYQLHTKVNGQGEIISLALPSLKFNVEDIFS
jgi:Uma2 family endonuclease